MSVRDSQGRSVEGEKEFSYAELCEEARKRSAEMDANEKEKKGKGLDFMAYRIDVARKHFELSVQRKVTPAESNLLLFLELGTIGAQNSRSQISSKAEFYIEDISKALGYKEKDKIWKLLKSLHSKGYILRDKTRSKNREILGLNPEVFSQILIDRHHEVDKKRHLRVAVDNTKQGVDNSADGSSAQPTDRHLNTDGSSGDHRQIVTHPPTDHRLTQTQVSENKDENPALYSSRSIYISSIGQNGNEETHVSQGERKREPTEQEIEERKRFLMEQARLLSV